LAAPTFTTEFLMSIIDYRTNEVIRTATAAEIARYEAQLADMTSSEREVGAVDGSDYGHAGTVYFG